MKTIFTVVTSAWDSYWHLLDQPLAVKEGLFKTAYKLLLTVTLYLIAMAIVSALLPGSPNSSRTQTATHSQQPTEAI